MSLDSFKEKQVWFTAEINGVQTLVRWGIAGNLEDAKKNAKLYWNAHKYLGTSTTLMLDGEDYSEGKTMHCFK